MKSTPVSVAPQALVVSNEQFDALRANLVTVLKDDFATNVKSINKQNVVAAKVLGYRNHQAFEDFQTKNPWETEKAFILTITLNNVVSEVILCKSVEEMESRFAMEYIKRGLVAQEADFEEGYALFDDNYCACMNTAYTSDDKLSPVKGGYIDENSPEKIESKPVSLAKDL